MWNLKAYNLSLQITVSIMSDELKKRHILSNDQNSLVLSNENGLCCSFYDFSLINST